MNTNRFGKFSERARRVLSLAEDEAARFNHNYIGTEHLILGLMREKDGLACKIVTNLEAIPEKVRSVTEFLLSKGERKPEHEIGLTPRAKRVIELAVEEARLMNHSYIGTGHLLIGLLREGEGLGAGVLESLGITIDRALEEMKKLLQPPTVSKSTSQDDDIAITKKEDWRNISKEDFESFLSMIAAKQKERRELGRKQYNTESFVGDPLEYAIEEALDLLFYLWVEARKQGRWS